jgi:hypothetical protein
MLQVECLHDPGLWVVECEAAAHGHMLHRGQLIPKEKRPAC